MYIINLNLENISRKSQDNRISIETKIVHEGEVNRFLKNHKKSKIYALNAKYNSY